MKGVKFDASLPAENGPRSAVCCSTLLLCDLYMSFKIPEDPAAYVEKNTRTGVCGDAITEIQQDTCLKNVAGDLY